ncbi:uncharacterized protein LOC115683085 isoform X1 [Syzygium oleosum]|uniref:uncharacterized protein LOC115683085 isoform X1 n=1 Tax=Syzygium oleosum TaxID=219896 RepID=UPI0011D2AADF|nr:uncharacterized protein LOC115683085 isoform X1 [Syzygium oleosum]
MALFLSPHPLSIRFLSRSSDLSLRHPCRFRFSASSSAAGAATATATATERDERNGVAILWYKHDLRVDDHPGIVAASRYQSVVPLYVFDHRLLSRFSDEMLELLLHALSDLKYSLREHGSDLLIRYGSAEKVIQELVKEVNATCLLTEEEVEYDMMRTISAVRETFAKVTSHLERNRDVELWRTPFYDLENPEDLPLSHEDLKKREIPLVSPFLCPAVPAAQMNLDWGHLPTYDYLKEFINGNKYKLKRSWTSLKETSAETILQKAISRSETSIKGDFRSNHAYRKRVENSVFVTQSGKIVGGGTLAVLNALAAYLRYLEGTARASHFGRVHERIREAESREGASFYALFGPALSLGILSRRRVYYEAIKYEKERNAGFLSPFGYSASTVAAAVDAVCSMEWYWVMALRNQKINEGMHSVRIWRWKGHLIQYTVVGDKGPAVLLVHGFGAFLEHFRDNLGGISDGGNRVWAITLLGFGRSEKPNIVYTELMWAELLRDFVIEVVGEPMHLVGNSIGGYVAAIFASLWPTLVKSVVLMNGAGDVVPRYSSIPLPKERQTSGATWLGARLLLFYLRLSIGQIVRNCYPVKTERADEWLINEMLRSSYDPGVLVVLESIFSINLSIPLNFLLKGFNGKILVVQGMEDPITNSKCKLAMLNEHCVGILTREIDAGHCPHDEVPELVNSILCEWIVEVEDKLHHFESCQ